MSANPIEQILGRGNQPAPSAPAPATPARPEDEQTTLLTEPAHYRPYIIWPRPQVAFCVVQQDGTMHGFQYHTLRHLKFERRDGDEFLSFTADGLAVVMQGRAMRVLFHALVRHTLLEAREYDGKPDPEGIATRIERLGVVDTRAELRLLK